MKRAKEKDTKTNREKVHRAKPPTPISAVDALIRSEEQNGKQGEKLKRKKQGACLQTSVHEPFSRLIQQLIYEYETINNF